MAATRPAANGTGKLAVLAFMAWRNIWRNPARSVLTVAALAGSMVLLLLYIALVGGMTGQMVEHATDLSVGHLQLQRSAFTADQDLYATIPTRSVERLERELPGAAIAPRLYASALASSAAASGGVMVKAVDPRREPRVTRLLDAVRSGNANLGDVRIDADGLPRYPVMVGAQLARNMQIGPGDELVLVTQAADASIGNGLFRVTGVLKPVDPAFDRTGVMMSLEAYRALMVMPQGFHELSVRLGDITQVDQAQDALQRAIAAMVMESPLDALGGPIVVRSWRQVMPAVADMIQVYDGVVWVMGAIVIALAALGMVNTMLMAIHERTHEFGILRAIGMDKLWLLAMVLLESLGLALLSALLGSMLGMALVRGLLRDGIDLSASLPDGFDMAGIVIDPVLSLALAPMQLVHASALVVLLAMLAALLPSWRVMRLEPAQAMR